MAVTFLTNEDESRIVQAAKEQTKTYERIATITVQPDADGNLPRHVLFSVDENGAAFHLSDFVIKAYAGFVDGSKSTLYMNLNGTCVIANSTIDSISTSCRNFNIFFRQEENGFMRLEHTNSLMTDTYYSAQSSVQNVRLIPPTSNIVSLPIVSVDLYTELGDSKCWTDGSRFELWGIRV